MARSDRMVPRNNFSFQPFLHSLFNKCPSTILSGMVVTVPLPHVVSGHPSRDILGKRMPTPIPPTTTRKIIDQDRQLVTSTIYRNEERILEMEK